MVIVGGGAAGLTAAETLRQCNFTGEIKVISSENVLPYDRSLLSKTLATGDASKFTLRSSDFLDQYNIDFALGTTVTSINKDSKSVGLDNGSTVGYDKLLLATGAQCKLPPNMPSSDVKGVYQLRSAAD
jgi:3-phenylpropionate/trans-cinnamate dioxygenase ferredoxin reductase subunit